MTTMDLINELRDQAEVDGPGTAYHLLNEAADRLEALDERVCIMSESYESIEKRMCSLETSFRLGVILMLAAIVIWAVTH